MGGRKLDDFTEKDNEVLVRIVKTAQARSVKGSKGEWKDFLKSSKHLKVGPYDPTKHPWSTLAEFVHTFADEADIQMVKQIRASEIRRKMFESFESEGIWKNTSEQELVRLTCQHRRYREYYTFPSSDKLPRKPHLDVVRRTLRYVTATLDYALFYEASTELQLSGFTDADWAGSVCDRRSTSGFMFSPGSAAITWSSKKQPTVALSSTEAEYRGVAVAACEVAWLELLFGDLGIQVQRPVVIHWDNLSSIQLVRNPVFHARTKHIEVHYHFISERVLDGSIDLTFVRTGE
ncbi:hypothetical protein L7F22_061923 [Adiantum nelumboides]|nr:hypothetical protein [Adiantum nelumboides]